MTTLGRFYLYPGELLRLDLGMQIGLRCARGRMLVSAGHQGTDHELHEGERLTCENGLVLVEGAGELLVERSRARGWWQRRDRIRLIGVAH